MEMTRKQIEIEAQNYLNGLDLPENADKQLILDNFKNGMTWMLMLIKEDKQQVMADKKNTISNEDKAIELAENISPYDIGGDNAAHYAAKDAALDALDWKDEQFAQEKQQMMQEFELLSSWFKHIEQMAKDRKTANGNIMNMRECLNEISVIAKDSREYIQKVMEEL